MAYMNQPVGMFNNPTVPTQYPQIQPVGGAPMYYPGRSVLPGRTVSKLDDIVPGDVPQDGSIGLFPQSDGSCIWAKSWTGDGKISTMKFIPEEINNSNEEMVMSTGDTKTPIFQSLSESINSMKESLDESTKSIEKTLNDILESLTSTTNQNGSNNSKEN